MTNTSQSKTQHVSPLPVVPFTALPSWAKHHDSPPSVRPPRRPARPVANKTRLRTKPNQPVHKINLPTRNSQANNNRRSRVPHPKRDRPTTSRRGIAHSAKAALVQLQRPRHRPPARRRHPPAHPACMAKPHAPPPPHHSRAPFTIRHPPTPAHTPGQPLSPQRPTHPPSRISGALCPGMGRGVPSTANRPSRGPVAMAPHRPVTAPTRCTTPQPAWSIAPTPSSGDGDSADSQPVESHTCAQKNKEQKGNETHGGDTDQRVGRGHHR